MKTLLPLGILFISCNGDIALVEKTTEEEDCSTEDAIILYVDDDGDGFGDPENAVAVCQVAEGLVVNSDDCNDNHPGIHPDAEEVCNGFDDNCDNEVDDFGVIEGFLDEDGDGYGSVAVSIESCEEPESLVDEGGDCDDTNPEIHPNAAERCDDIDWDCDGGASTSTEGDVSCDVLIYEGHTSETHQVGENDLVSFTEVLGEEGASVSYAYELPEDLSSYTMVYVSHANRPFAADEAQIFLDYRDAGGTLLLVGENNQWGAGMLPVYNDLLSLMNISGGFLDEGYDPSCEGWIGTVEGPHTVLEGVEEVSYAFTSALDLGANGIGLVRGESGQLIFADLGGVFVSADSTMFMDHCEGAFGEDNRQLVRNLFNYSSIGN